MMSLASSLSKLAEPTTTDNLVLPHMLWNKGGLVVESGHTPLVNYILFRNFKDSYRVIYLKGIKLHNKLVR